MDEAPEGIADTDADGPVPTPPSDEGLSAFPDNESPDDTSAANGGSSSDTSATKSTGETVGLTGTIVQTRTPVILSDGMQTKTVDTDADLGPGDEVTVSRTKTGGRISAESIEVHTGAQ